MKFIKISRDSNTSTDLEAPTKLMENPLSNSPNDLKGVAKEETLKAKKKDQEIARFVKTNIDYIDGTQKTDELEEKIKEAIQGITNQDLKESLTRALNQRIVDQRKFVAITSNIVKLENRIQSFEKRWMRYKTHVENDKIPQTRDQVREMEDKYLVPIFNDLSNIRQTILSNVQSFNRDQDKVNNSIVEQMGISKHFIAGLLERTDGLLGKIRSMLIHKRKYPDEEGKLPVARPLNKRDELGNLDFAFSQNWYELSKTTGAMNEVLKQYNQSK